MNTPPRTGAAGRGNPVDMLGVGGGDWAPSVVAECIYHDQHHDNCNSHLTPLGVPSQDILDNDRSQGESHLYLCLDIIANHLLEHQSMRVMR